MIYAHFRGQAISQRLIAGGRYHSDMVAGFASRCLSEGFWGWLCV